MRNSRIRHNLMRIGRRNIITDSGRKGLNHLGLITMGRVLRRDFLIKVYINKISPLGVEINPLVQPQVKMTTQRENP
jgi:hypothetical protein